jgi:galactosamine-6-phosphate isomerase
MKITYVDTYEDLSRTAAQLVLQELRKKPDLLLCCATGNSPTGLYKNLAHAYQQNPSLFQELRILKLDEWGDLTADDPSSCDYYLREHVVGPLHIAEDRYLGFQNNPPDPVEECARILELLRQQGPIDICVLGLGANGHMGLNEPAAQLQPHCHVAQLSETTLSHGMIAESVRKPSFGMTIGIEDILASRQVIMLVVGAGKEKATEQLISGEISNQFPATHLWRHAHTDCLIVQKGS